MDPRYASRGSGFTLVELLVAVAIFSVVMAGIAIVFNSTLHANNAIRARLEDYSEFRGFADFIERDISAAYRSVDLDDRFTFMGGKGRAVFIGVSQNFGETDFTLMSYYTVPDPDMMHADSEYEYRRLMRMAVPLPHRAVKAFTQSYPRFESGIESGIEFGAISPDTRHFFPSDNLLENIIDAEDPEPSQIYVDAAEFLLDIPPGDRLFPGLHPDEDSASMDHVRALFAVLHLAYGVEYGWDIYEWNPVEPERDEDGNDKYAPRLDDFELASLIGDEAGDGFGLRFRYGRIRANPDPDVGVVDVHFPEGQYHGYSEYPETLAEREALDSEYPETLAERETLDYDWRDGWDARIEGGPPEVVEVNVAFRSKTRRRGEPHSEKFDTIVYVPMGFDLGTN